MITECTYCNEPLQEEEIKYYETYVNALPLCMNCGINLW